MSKHPPARRFDGAPYGPKEDAIIRAAFRSGLDDTATARRLTKAGFARTESSVAARRHALRLLRTAAHRSGPAWEPYDEIIRAGRAQNLGFADIALKVVEAGRTGTTRNAVIGRARRLGLGTQEAGTRRPRRRAATEAAAALAPAQAKKASQAPKAAATAAAPVLVPQSEPERPQPRPEPGPAGGVAFLDALRTDGCRWPLSGEGLAMRVCGAPVLEGQAWCAHCRPLVYQRGTALAPRPAHDMGVHRVRASGDDEPDVLAQMGEAA